HGTPFHRRTPHSATKHASANKNIAGVCHSGIDAFSVIGAFRFGKPLAKAVSFDGSTISPPVRLLSDSNNARFGLSERNSSAAGSLVHPADARPTSAPF